MDFLADLLPGAFWTNYDALASACWLPWKEQDRMLCQFLVGNGTGVAEVQSQKGKSAFRLRLQWEVAQQKRVGTYVPAWGKDTLKIEIGALEVKLVGQEMKKRGGKKYSLWDRQG